MRDQEAIDDFIEAAPAIPGDSAPNADADSMTGLSSWMSLFHLTPLVLAARIPMLMAETAIYYPLEREETRLAVSEKVDAVVEGAIAFQTQWNASVLALQAATFEGKFAPTDYFSGFGELTSTALKPVLDRLQSNVDRLG